MRQVSISRPRYAGLSQWLRTRMARAGISVPELSIASGVGTPALRSYVAGLRKPGAEKAQAIAAVLRVANESLDDAEESLNRTLEQYAERRDFFQELDSSSATLRTMTHSYEPFADGKSLFVDRLFERFFRLSSIQRQPVGDDVGFQLRHRLDMLDAGKCDIATNLLGTLTRLKRCRFFWTPVRISLGAVCLRKHARKLQDLKEVFAPPDSSGRCKALWPVVVDSEVGAVYVEKSLGFDVRSDPAHFVDDLDPVKIADRLCERKGSGMEIPCAITDEVTAFAVMRELGDEALLLVPPTTAESVETSRLRRELPSHLLGAAISRKNRQLGEYFDDACEAMLRCDQESIATSYADLFTELTSYVERCLEGNPLIADSRSGFVDLRSLTTENKDLFVHRTAHAYSRWALHLDKRSFESFGPSSSPWRGVLSRAREITLTQEAEDRHFVRRRLRLMVEEALGEGIFSPENDSGVQSLHTVLEQEFDVRLAQQDLTSLPKAGAPIERLTSWIQRTMESSSTIALQTTVSKARHEQSSTLEYLRHELRAELSEAAGSTEELQLGECFKESLLAVFRGKCVGCVDIHTVEGKQTYQLRNLFVKQNLRKHGIGRVLIRGALESAASANMKRVAIDLTRVPVRLKSDSARIVQFFQRNGFQGELPGDLLEYNIF